MGFDPKTKIFLPFQAISQRIKRKYDIEQLQKKLPVEINVFDIIQYEGNSLINDPFKKRTELIKKIVAKKPYKIKPANQIITSNEKEALDFFKKALKENQEGVMIKNLEARYQPGSRVGHMLKLKGQGKDFDLVITGAEYGTGKRSGWLSSFILSCASENGFLEVGKVGTGIKEKEQEEGAVSFIELTEKLKPLIEKEVGKQVIVKPKVIVSITYQEIQRSPNYNSGYALRFPRLNSIRIDKPISEINSLEDIEQEYKAQSEK